MIGQCLSAALVAYRLLLRALLAAAREVVSLTDLRRLVLPRLLDPKHFAKLVHRLPGAGLGFLGFKPRKLARLLKRRHRLQKILRRRPVLHAASKVDECSSEPRPITFLMEHSAVRDRLEPGRDRARNYLTRRLSFQAEREQFLEARQQFVFDPVHFSYPQVP